jgi:lipid-A-disaccharide synthase
MKHLSFMLIAGEASGDLLAAELVKALRQSREVHSMSFPPRFFGAGGPKMAEAGVELALDLTRHSVTGLSDALKKYFQFRKIFARLFQLARDREPELIICVDFSGFNRRFAHAVKEHVRGSRGSFNNWEPKIVQYVSPQVWASRPGRALQLERDIDLLLSILPFEKEWYAARAPKLRVEFVGHPVVDRYAITDSSAPREPRGDASTLDRKSQILLLPGSRVGELKRHLPVIVDAVKRVAAVRPVRPRMVLPNESLATLAGSCRAQLHDLQIEVGELAPALPEAAIALASTGTVTLECACRGVPTVALYKTSWTNYLIARQILTVNYLAMPNLLAGEEIYPEFIQHRATGENIARAALDLLNDPGRRGVVKAKLSRIVRSLGGPGASTRAAGAVLSLLKEMPFPIRAALER